MDIDFSCSLDSCKSICVRGSHYCQAHKYLYNKYGTPTPMVPCHECGVEYQFISGKGQKGQYRICPDCQCLMEKYCKYIPKWTSIYGVTRVFIVKMLIAQDFRCFICNRKPKENLVIDHDHSCCPSSNRNIASRSCGKCIRGLLCVRCNVLLGHYENNPGLIDKMAKYVELHKVSS